MNIEGIYKVNIEQTVRKIGETEDASIQRMLRKYIGDKIDDVPQDPRKEAKIQKMIADYQKDELATTMRLEITADRASIRSTDGDGDYPIKSRTITEDGKISMVVEIPDAGEEMQWDVTMVGDRILVFSGDNEMGDFVWERV
jgi:hypothetical protein